jgi:hypothetical protein
MMSISETKERVNSRLRFRVDGDSYGGDHLGNDALL